MVRLYFSGLLQGVPLPSNLHSMFLKKIYPPLQQALEEAGLEKAYPFQKKLIGAIKSGGHVVAYADEGEGKSTALAISLIQVLKEEKDDVPRSLYLVLDNEKLDNMMQKFSSLVKHTSLRVIPANTKKNILDQKDDIYFGSDIVVGVPERISELMSIEGINIAEIRYVFIDDASTLMRHSSLSNVNRILQSFPKAQLVFCGKESTDGIERYAENFMNFPSYISDKNDA